MKYENIKLQTTQHVVYNAIIGMQIGGVLALFELTI